MTTALVPAAQSRLEFLEGRIETLLPIVRHAQEAAVEIGRALAEIQAGHLYEGRFDQYVSRRFGMSKSHAYRLIAFVRFLVSPVGDKVSIKNENQVRVITDGWKASGTATAARLNELAAKATEGMSAEEKIEAAEESEALLAEEETAATDAERWPIALLMLHKAKRKFRTALNAAAGAATARKAKAMVALVSGDFEGVEERLAGWA